MSIQGQTIVETALKYLGVYQSGETPSAADAVDGFARLNAFVDFLATQRLTMNGIQKFSLAVVASHQPYTLGVGGDFNQVRPTFIDDVTLTLAGTTPTDIPVVPFTQDEYAFLAAKTVTAQLATNWYYNATYNLSTVTGALYFWPILNDTSVTINLWLPVALTAFATPTTVYTLLPGWQAMLEANVAAWMAPMLGVELPPRVASIAAATMGYIKGINADPGLAAVDPGLLKPSAQMGGGNWLTGPALFLAAELCYRLFT